MKQSLFNWKISGKAGEGISATGLMMGKIAQRHGLVVTEYSEYPSLIRGGHTTSQVRASDKATYGPQQPVDLMVVLQEEALKLHLSEFSATTRFIVDTEKKIDISNYPSLKSEQFFLIPLSQLARETTGKTLAADIIALAVSCQMLGLDKAICNKVITEFFQAKGEAIVIENLKAAEAGWQFATENNKTATAKITSQSADTLFITGSEAIGLGALSAGVQYFAAYPMTPASNLMHFMAAAQNLYPLVVKHTEDEIAAVNEALGASFAGLRAMTGTAGGGFALMVEGVSLAAITELPLVVVVGQRPAPATGLPTWTAQTDLQFVMHAGHGEFPRIVFTPGNVEESFKLTRLAFILAEKYQTQSYVISDKLLLESRFTTPAYPAEYDNARYSFANDPLPEDESYRRFPDTPEGYSPRAVPGQAHGLQLTNSYEHDTYGYATEDGPTTKVMVDKRLRKLKGLINEVPGPVLLGPAEASVTLVTWGSSRLVVEEALDMLNVDGKAVANAIHILTMLPFKVEEFKTLAAKAKKLVMIEANATRQGESHIFEQTGVKMHDRLNKYDGRPFYVEEIIKKVNENL